MGKARDPDNDASYLLNFCDEVLGMKTSREHRLDWLRGDLSPRTGRATTLPVDGYWASIGVVVKVMESQHFVSAPHFDKPVVLTVSGEPPLEQRVPECPPSYSRESRTARE